MVIRGSLTYCEEEILDRKVPELPAGQCIDEVLLVKVLVGSCTVRPLLEPSE